MNAIETSHCRTMKCVDWVMCGAAWIFTITDRQPELKGMNDGVAVCTYRGMD